MAQTFYAVELDPSYRWLMLGDFNMTVMASSQRGGTGSVISGRESRAWNQLIWKLTLSDTFSPRRGHLQFS